MTEENRIIHALWVGKTLSLIELLTLYSFTHHGHIIYLWTYGEIETALPPGVIIQDANLIIPEKEIFYKKDKDPVAGVGKGSIGAPFSDLFRYKLLYEYGGWWVDMDVTCLKPLDISEPYFFRGHLILDVIGNVIKCPKGSELMRRTYREVKETCDEHTREWLLPNKILNKHIHELDLMRYKQVNVSNKDEWAETKTYILKNTRIPEKWMIIHWTNEEWRMNKIDKNHIRIHNSALGSLLLQYKVPCRQPNVLKRMRNEIIFFSPVRKAFQLSKKIYYFFGGHIKYWVEKLIFHKHGKK